jgi:tetratricopeptide (TPR) repeat protein
MLREQYPGTRFEVLNTSMVGINSHVILPIARECAGYQPDMFVVLLGNNEVVGPFGAAGVNGPYSPKLGLIRTNLFVKTTRTGQLLSNTSQRVSGWFKRSGSGGSTPHSWKGMSMFLNSQLRWTDPRLAVIHQHLGDNVRAIIDAGAQAGAQVVVCTVPVNLKESAPFASLHHPDLSASQLDAWKRLYQDGIAREEAGDFPAAVKLFEEAARIDDQYADLEYRLGRCFIAMKQPDQARNHFLRTRDLDALRFRSDAKTNDVLRTAVADSPREGVHLVDAEQIFAEKSPDQLPGENLFLEHVHLNFSGNYLLARSLFEKIADILPSAVQSRKSGSAGPLSEEACAARLAFTGWTRFKHASMIQDLLSEVPFTSQLDHAEREKRWAKKIEDLGKFAKRDALPQAAAVYQKALEDAPNDWMLQMHFGSLLHESGDLTGALGQYEAVVKANPHIFSAHVKIGDLYCQLGQFDRGAAHYRAALKFNPDFDAAHYSLASALASMNKMDEAMAVFTNRLATAPDRADVLEKMGQFLVKIRRPREAFARLTEALEIDPNNPSAHYWAATLLEERGAYAEAITHLDEALRVRPSWQAAVQFREHLTRLQKNAK